MELIQKARSHFSQDIARAPDMEGLSGFFAGLSDADLIEFATCLVDCVEQLRPSEQILFPQFILKETTKRALSADEQKEP